MNSWSSVAARGSVVAARSRVSSGLRWRSSSQTRRKSSLSASPTWSGPRASRRGSSASGSNGQSTAAASRSALLPKKCATRAASTPAAAAIARSEAPS